MRDRISDLAVTEVEAEWIDVAIKEAAFSLVDLVDRLGLIRFQGGNRFCKHGFGIGGGARLLRKLFGA